MYYQDKELTRKNKRLTQNIMYSISNLRIKSKKN